jgi:DNA-binding IclR family transcriptional regulator
MWSTLDGGTAARQRGAWEDKPEDGLMNEPIGVSTTVPDGDPAQVAAGVPAVKSAERALRLLEVLATDKRASFAVIQRELAMPKSSLHALLATMSGLGWVTTDRRGAFTLGYRAHALGIAGMDDSAFISLTDDLLEDVNRQVEETVHLARLDGKDVLYLVSKYARHALNVHFEVGRRLPAYVTALGKAMLAELPEATVREHLPKKLTPMTAYTIISVPNLLADLARVRELGYASDNQEGTLGLHCFAVAVHHLDLPLFAVSCSVPTVRLDDAKAAQVTEALLRLKTRLLARVNPGKLSGSSA